MLLGNIAWSPLILPMPSTASAALLLFVKAPQPGTVKTRLGKDIGFDCSCQLYRCFGLDIVQRLQTLDWPLLLFFAPKDGESLVRDWLGSHTFYPQVGENLGDASPPES